MTGDPFFTRPRYVRPIDTSALGPIRVEARAPLTVRLRALVHHGHVSQEVDPETIGVIVIGSTRFVREGRS